jgi:hypothetical protein
VSDQAPSPNPDPIPPGWYGDPLNAGHARWWSGHDWTHHVQQVPDASESAVLVAPNRSDRSGRVATAVIGVLFAAILTLVAVYSARP